jgi:hypothetical protein
VVPLWWYVLGSCGGDGHCRSAALECWFPVGSTVLKYQARVPCRGVLYRLAAIAWEPKHVVVAAVYLYTFWCTRGCVKDVEGSVNGV